jgi:hypothetical protein
MLVKRRSSLVLKRSRAFRLQVPVSASDFIPQEVILYILPQMVARDLVYLETLLLSHPMVAMFLAQALALLHLCSLQITEIQKRE